MRRSMCMAACAGLAVALSANAQQIYTNGPLSTGVLSGSGILAPPGATWSELAEDCAMPTATNGALGFQCSPSTQTRLADDFTVPAGSWWTITSVVVSGYQTGSTTTSTITGATVRIWSGRPGHATSTVVFGDEGTNRLTASSFGISFRVQNTTAPMACGGAVAPPDTDRPIMSNTIAVGTVLGPGTYWIDFALSGTGGSGPWSPLTTLANCGRQADPNANALQFFQGSWIGVVDTGLGCSPVSVPQALPFRLLGSVSSGPPCYANCDASTVAPCLNVNDFICFNNLFVANAPGANCDASTIPPVLNVIDFICFNNRFATGCAAPCSAP